MKFSRLLEGLDIINIFGDSNQDVSSVCYSADQCEDGSLFVAVTGLKHDGHDFIMEAIDCGARFIVYEKDFHAPSQVTAIKVADSRRALSALAKNYFECGVLGTVNYRYNDKTFPAPNTTPESYELQKILREMADDEVTHVIAEVSSHAVDLKRVDDCDFDLGVFTNLTRDHLDYHLTMENYYQAKKRFFAEVLPQSKKVHPQKMVINADDQWGQRILREVKLPAITYGIENDSAIGATNYELSLAGIKARINLAGETCSITSTLIGKFNLYNILAAAAAASILKISSSAIKRGIENLFYVPGRLEKVDSSSGFNIFVDYAHTDDALRRVLQNLDELKKKRIITVFGCGGNRDRGKRPLMGEAATTYSNLTIVTSDNPRLEDPLAIIAEIETGIDSSKIQKIKPGNLHLKNGTQGYTVVPERRKAIETAISAAQAGDIILIAGKGHEDYQILGTDKVPFDDRVVVKQTLEERSRLQ
ncbi:MAG: UDP-N-acetylmuramoyl-L-alanyl-D-glutamate--2,6-diaminopimelate ligase [Deltaproteobacteria bacterium]|nr:UDP-N-acetylmuramoyl-L-alanyl-D-glutamate--2,6-diaminopimelate ligase [Deltaproteobacteria bacterium]